MEFRRSVCFVSILVSSLLFRTSHGYKFYVGGRDGWVLDPSENFNHWAERNRFQVNDTLYFKYKKGSDSVLLVNKNDYYSCNTKNPIKKMEEGNSEFKFDRSGPFFFISGKDDQCQKGQKLIVVVLAVRPTHNPSPPPAQPPKSATPPVSQPPKTSPSPVSPPQGSHPPHVSPSSAPSHSPARAPSKPPSSPSPAANPPKSSSPAPAKSPVSPPAKSPAPHSSPSPAATPGHPPHHDAPVQPPKTSPSPKTSPGGSAEIEAPAPTPTRSSASGLVVLSVTTVLCAALASFMAV